MWNLNKKEGWFKCLHVFSAVVLILNMSMIGVFFVAEDVEANAEPEPSCEEGSVRLLNASFEEPLVTDSKGWELFTNPLVGWFIEWLAPNSDAPEDPLLEIHNGVKPTWSASEGDQYAELDADYGAYNNEPASIEISQVVDTFIGAEYRLTYDFSPRPGVGDDNVLVVKINDTTVATHNADGGGDANGSTDWESYSYDFTADSDQVNIAFADGSDPDSLGTFIDNVALEIIECNQEPVCDYTIDGYKRNVYSEEPLEDWLIELWQDDELVATTTTNDNGWYEFEELCAGEYEVYEEVPSGWQQVYPIEEYERDYHVVYLGEIERKSDERLQETYDFWNVPGICGYKYNYNTEEKISGWDIYLKEISECEEGDQYADRVVSYEQGKQLNGDPVKAVRSIPEQGLEYEAAQEESSFFSLGFGGWIIVEFDNPIVNTNGADFDLKVTEDTWGGGYPSETANVYASQTGNEDDWTFVGAVDNHDLDEIHTTFELDLGSLDWATFIKVVDTSDPEDFEGRPTADGYDLNAIEGLVCENNVEEVIDETTTNDDGLYCFFPEPGDYRVEEGQRDDWSFVDYYFMDGAFDGEDVWWVDFWNKPDGEPEPFCGDYNIDEGEDCDDGPNGSETCTADCTFVEEECVAGEALLDEVPADSLSTWTEASLSGNPAFTYEEIVSPFDDSTAIKTAAVGSSYSPCHNKNIYKIYDISGNTMDSNLQAYLAFASSMDTYNFPYLTVNLLDEDNESLASQIYYGQGVISGIYANYAAGNPDSYTELPMAEGDMEIDLSVMGDIDFAKVKVTLANYACVGENSVVFDHLRLVTHCGEEIERGEIRVCKYEDYDGDGERDYVPDFDGNDVAIGFIDTVREFFVKTAQAVVGPMDMLSGWVMNLTNNDDIDRSGATDEGGCVTFGNLPYGTYVITEESQSGWTQTYPGPDSFSHTVELDSESETVYFLNYYDPESDPVCGDGNLDSGEECDDGNNEKGDGCSADCENEGSGGGPDCGNGVRESGEECDKDDGDFENGEYCNSDCEIVSGSNPIIPPSHFGSSIFPTVAGEEAFPALVLDKDVDRDFANPGDDDIIYTLTITNSADAKLAAFNVEITDNLPIGLVYADDQSVSRTWAVGDLAIGDTRQYTYKVAVVEGTAAGTLSNTAIATADNHEDISASAELDVVIPQVLAETGFDLFELMMLAITMFGAAAGSVVMRQELNV